MGPTPLRMGLIFLKCHFNAFDSTQFRISHSDLFSESVSKLLKIYTGHPYRKFSNEISNKFISIGEFFLQVG